MLENVDAEAEEFTVTSQTSTCKNCKDPIFLGLSMKGEMWFHYFYRGTPPNYWPQVKCYRARDFRLGWNITDEKLCATPEG